MYSNTEGSKKNHNGESQSNPHLIDGPDWLQQLYEKRRTVGIAFAILLLFLGLFAWWMNHRERHLIENLNQAESIVYELTKSHKLFENPTTAQSMKGMILKLQELAKKDGEVRQRFNGILAEIDLLQGKTATPATAEAIMTLNRQELSYYAQFSEMTLLAQKNRPREALELADKLLKSHSIGALPQLLAFTLLQKATLYKAIDKNAEAMKTLTELKNVIRNNPDMLNHIQEKGVTLIDFLEKK